MIKTKLNKNKLTEKNNMKKTNTKIIVTVALFISIIFGSLFLQDISKMFKASLLQVSEVPEFDGTVYPVAYVPNWTSVGYDNSNKLYSDYTESDFVAIPEYDAASLAVDTASLSWSDQDDLSRINAKITYSVPYLGSYDISNQLEGSGSHPAVDIVAPKGTPVYAIANGQVVKASNATYGFGKHIVIGHANVPTLDGKSEENLYSSYSHLNGIEVEDGDIVKKGELIGYLGETGTATTPHLHFQIDIEDAPFHPYWPFTSTEASSAGYNFFSAINAAFGIENSRKYTINPIVYVQKYLDYDGVSHGAADEDDDSDETNEDDDGDDEADDTSDEVDLDLNSFELFYETTKVEPGEEISIAAEAQNKSGLKISDYDEAAKVKIISENTSDETSVLFEDGQAVFSVIAPDEEGLFSVTLSSGDINTKQNFEAEYSSDSYTYELEFTEPFATIDQSVRLKVKAIKGGIVDKEYDSVTPLVFEADSDVQISDESLNGVDFYNGEAKTYVRGLDEGTYTVKLLVNEKEFESNEITIVGEVKKATAFKIEHDGRFVPGIAEEVKVIAVDENGDPTPSYTYPGTVTLSATPEGGKFIPTNLSLSDFEYGTATVKYTRDDSIATVITAKQGAIRGDSKPLTVSGNDEDIFSDVDTSHEYARAISYLKSNDIIGGYPDGTFKPVKTVSRVEALKMILLGFDINLSPTADLTFPDTDDDQWYAPYVGRSVKLGVVRGYPDGSFKPAQTVNKAEFLKILFEATDIPTPEDVTSDPYPDVPSDAWYAGYAAYASEKNLVPLDEDGKLNPSDGMTRSDVAEVIYRLIAIEKTGAGEYTASLTLN